MAMPKAKDRNLFEKVFLNHDRGWVVVSPADGSHPDRLLAPLRNSAGREVYKTHFGFAARGVRACSASAGEIFLAVLLLTFISFVAGLVANTNVGRRVMRWFENSFLGGLPQLK